jgi:hypothetical protein
VAVFTYRQLIHSTTLSANISDYRTKSESTRMPSAVENLNEHTPEIRASKLMKPYSNISTEEHLLQQSAELSKQFLSRAHLSL